MANTKNLDPMDLYDIRSLLTDEERMVKESVGRFVDEQVLPGIQDGWNRKGLVSETGERKQAFGVLRDHYRKSRA